MKYISTIVTIVFSLHLAHGQGIPSPQKLTAFSFMTGEWEGSGTYYSQQGSHELKVAESITFSGDSTILLISGKGFDHQGNNHHDAFGVMYFENGQVKIHAFTKQGQNVIAEVTKTGERAIDWGFELPNGGKIKYSASFTDTTWKESGTYTTPDGSQSFPTVKMQLTRK